MHLWQHSDICEAIRILSSTGNLWNTRGMTINEWTIHRKKNLQAIESILSRELKPYEKQMFLFAKSCHICHQQHNLTSTCLKCYSHYLCNDHKVFNVVHDCLQLKRSLFLDIEDLIEKPDMKILHCHLPDTMNDIIVNYNMKLIVQRYKGHGSNMYLWKPDDYKYSNCISGPLTLCYAMQHLSSPYCLQINETFEIHIIAGSLMDVQSLSAWEIVLHVLLPGTKLTIIMVESELDNAHISLWDVCEVCRASNKTLYFETRIMTYENYVQYPFFYPPDVIVGFQANLREMRPSVIREIRRLACPLILTTVSELGALKNSKQIRKVLSTCSFPRINGENNFRSNKPQRNLEGHTFFRNNYLTVYEQL